MYPPKSRYAKYVKEVEKGNLYADTRRFAGGNEGKGRREGGQR